MAYALTLGTISFFLAVIWGRPLINLLKQKGVGKQIRIEQPGSHQIKTGTPTTGGLMIIIPVVLITGALNLANLLGFNYIGQSTLLLMGCMVMFGLLGFIDDLEGVRGRRAKGEGLMARSKAWWQFVFATIIACVLYFGHRSWITWASPRSGSSFASAPGSCPSLSSSSLAPPTRSTSAMGWMPWQVA